MNLKSILPRISAYAKFMLPIMLMLGVVAFFRLQDLTRNMGIAQLSELAANNERAAHQAARQVEAVSADLRNLAKHLTPSITPESDSAARAETIWRDMQMFISNKNHYDRIRFINPGGQEMTDPDDSHTGKTVAPTREGDDIFDPVWQALSKLDQGEVYLSGPAPAAQDSGATGTGGLYMIFGTPVINPAGEKAGYLMLDYDARGLLAYPGMPLSPNSRQFVVTESGYWIERDGGRNGAINYGQRFADDHPQIWVNLRSGDSGQMSGSTGVVAFTTRDFSSVPEVNTGKQFKMVSVAPSITWISMTPGLLLRWFKLDLILYMLALMGWAMMVHASLKCQFAESESEHKQRFLSAMKDTSLTSIIINIDGRIIFCNDKFLDITGWKREQALGQNWFEQCVPEEIREAERALIHEAITRKRAPVPHESEIQTVQNERLLISWNSTLSFDAVGKVDGVTCIGEDVTKKRHVEEQLRKLSRAVEQSPSIVIITDNKGCIEYVNPKFTQVTGYTPEEVVGENPRTLKSGEMSPGEYRHLWKTITSGQEWRGEFHNRKKSGELYWEAASISPIRNPDGEISHYVAVKEDITERKRLASEVETRNQELLKHRELTAIGRLANMVAHDLRNPLSSVKMGLQILQKQAHIGEQERELMQISMDQVRYMEEILTDLLIFSRPDAIKLEWISIDKLLETTVASLQKQIDEHHVAVSLHCQPGLPTVHGDPVKLRQVFSNLIINAVQACSGLLERKPEVVVNVALAIGHSGTKLQVEVNDNGPGIPPALSEKVFEPFFTMRAKGSGLGLSIVKRIVEQHHGQINLEPRSHGGTSAVVRLLLGPIGEFTIAPETVT